ncbi:MAG: DUF559 domain-containing protein [Fimbriimonadaceae bacterium]|nr:MAG: DUF559 domain-containing protein [Fimbriimonadaceae bacterium]
MKRFATSQAKSFSKNNRKNLTTVEAALWSRLRVLRSENLVFRRQHPVGPYIADFAHLKSKTVIELIGKSHAESGSADLIREKFFHDQGWQILYFDNLDVIKQIDWVVERIVEAVAR